MEALDATVREVMTESVRTVGGDLSVREVAATLSAEDTETVVGLLVGDRTVPSPYTYECADCGYRVTADSHPETCPKCGGRMRNLSVARE